MTPEGASTQFDPRAILAALQRQEAEFVLIGGLARVIRGADEVTRGVDICASIQPTSFERLRLALLDVGAADPDGYPVAWDEERLQSDPLIATATASGELKLVAIPAGVPRGYDALRASATRENLGGGLRPQVASTADLITMAAALGRDTDLARLPMLRRILELEADPAALLPRRPTPREPSTAELVREPTNPAERRLPGEQSFGARQRAGRPGPGPGVGR